MDKAYAQTKSALLNLLAGRPSADWERVVPATPEWRVRDVIAHVTGLAVDGANGLTPGNINLLEQFRDQGVVRARDEYAQGHVTSRREQTPADLVAEWTAAEPRLLSRLASDRPEEDALPFGMDVVLVTDLCVHSDDVAGALDQEPWPDSLASKVALAGYCFGVDYRVRALELPALTLRYGGKERVLGEREPGAALTADRWELLRTFAGRRSTDQIAAMTWSGDPAPYLPIIPAYGERTEPLLEAASSR
jgi:uncharacterized protein (TIGR03083 family)